MTSSHDFLAHISGSLAAYAAAPRTPPKNSQNVLCYSEVSTPFTVYDCLPSAGKAARGGRQLSRATVARFERVKKSQKCGVATAHVAFPELEGSLPHAQSTHVLRFERTALEAGLDAGTSPCADPPSAPNAEASRESLAIQQLHKLNFLDCRAFDDFSVDTYAAAHVVLHAAPPARPATHAREHSLDCLALELDNVAADARRAQLYVRGLDSSLHAVEVDLDHSVCALKSAVRLSLGVPSAHQRLLHNGTQLEDGRSLASYGLRSGGEVLLVLRVVGGTRRWDPDTGAPEPQYYENDDGSLRPNPRWHDDDDDDHYYDQYGDERYDAPDGNYLYVDEDTEAFANAVMEHEARAAQLALTTQYEDAVRGRRYAIEDWFRPMAIAIRNADTMPRTAVFQCRVNQKNAVRQRDAEESRRAGRRLTWLRGKREPIAVPCRPVNNLAPGMSEAFNSCEIVRRRHSLHHAWEAARHEWKSFDARLSAQRLRHLARGPVARAAEIWNVMHLVAIFLSPAPVPLDQILATDEGVVAVLEERAAAAARAPPCLFAGAYCVLQGADTSKPSAAADDGSASPAARGPPAEIAAATDAELAFGGHAPEPGRAAETAIIVATAAIVAGSAVWGYSPACRAWLARNAAAVGTGAVLACAAARAAFRGAGEWARERATRAALQAAKDVAYDTLNAKLPVVPIVRRGELSAQAYHAYLREAHTTPDGHHAYKCVRIGQRTIVTCEIARLGDSAPPQEALFYHQEPVTRVIRPLYSAQPDDDSILTTTLLLLSDAGFHYLDPYVFLSALCTSAGYPLRITSATSLADVMTSIALRGAMDYEPRLANTISQVSQIALGAIDSDTHAIDVLRNCVASTYADKADGFFASVAHCAAIESRQDASFVDAWNESYPPLALVKNDRGSYVRAYTPIGPEPRAKQRILALVVFMALYRFMRPSLSACITYLNDRDIVPVLEAAEPVVPVFKPIKCKQDVYARVAAVAFQPLRTYTVAAVMAIGECYPADVREGPDFAAKLAIVAANSPASNKYALLLENVSLSQLRSEFPAVQLEGARKKNATQRFDRHRGIQYVYERDHAFDPDAAADKAERQAFEDAEREELLGNMYDDANMNGGSADRDARESRRYKTSLNAGKNSHPPTAAPAAAAGAPAGGSSTAGLAAPPAVAALAITAGAAQSIAPASAPSGTVAALPVAPQHARSQTLTLKNVHPSFSSGLRLAEEKLVPAGECVVGDQGLMRPVNANVLGAAITRDNALPASPSALQQTAANVGSILAQLTAGHRKLGVSHNHLAYCAALSQCGSSSKVGNFLECAGIKSALKEKRHVARLILSDADVRRKAFEYLDTILALYKAGDVKNINLTVFNKHQAVKLSKLESGGHRTIASPPWAVSLIQTALGFYVPDSYEPESVDDYIALVLSQNGSDEGGYLLHDSNFQTLDELMTQRPLHWCFTDPATYFKSYKPRERCAFMADVARWDHHLALETIHAIAKIVLGPLGPRIMDSMCVHPILICGDAIGKYPKGSHMWPSGNMGTLAWNTIANAALYSHLGYDILACGDDSVVFAPATEHAALARVAGDNGLTLKYAKASCEGFEFVGLTVKYVAGRDNEVYFDANRTIMHGVIAGNVPVGALMTSLGRYDGVLCSDVNAKRLYSSGASYGDLEVSAALFRGLFEAKRKPVLACADFPLRVPEKELYAKLEAALSGPSTSTANLPIQRFAENPDTGVRTVAFTSQLPLAEGSKLCVFFTGDLLTGTESTPFATYPAQLKAALAACKGINFVTPETKNKGNLHSRLISVAGAYVSVVNFAGTGAAIVAVPVGMSLSNDNFSTAAVARPHNTSAWVALARDKHNHAHAVQMGNLDLTLGLVKHGLSTEPGYCGTPFLADGRVSYVHIGTISRADNSDYTNVAAVLDPSRFVRALPDAQEAEEQLASA